MRIVFMGTPDYSVATLSALAEAGHDIIAVFCQPDKPVGRKQILTPPPVKVWAIENNISVYQPKTLRDGQAFEILKEISPDVIVVVAYGKLLPKEILELPHYGCINGHASILPRHRGASPIQWSIVCGDKVTGVTTMLMDEGMDTGDILDVATTEISPDDTGESLFDRLSVISADLMVKTLNKIKNGTCTPVKQTEDGASYAPIIKKEMAHIDFSLSAMDVHNAIRGYYSWPCAYFILEGKRIKVLESRISNDQNEPFGTVITTDGKFIVSCAESSAVELVRIQPEGSKPMGASQWLCGHKLPVGLRIFKDD